MVVGAVSLAVLLPQVIGRTAAVETPAESASRGSASGSAAPSPSSSAIPSGSTSPAAPSAADEVADVVVLGDGDSAGDAAWPALLEDELGNAEVQVAAAAGAGYLTTGAGGETIPQMADDVDLAGADLVIVFGSRNDGAGQAEQVAEAARALFRVIAEAAPDAELLVIGPPWLSEPVPTGVRENRAALRAAAASAEATFVDPLAERWFADRSDLVTATGNPSGTGQLYLAGLIEAKVRALLTG